MGFGSQRGGFQSSHLRREKVKPAQLASLLSRKLRFQFYIHGGRGKRVEGGAGGIPMKRYFSAPLTSSSYHFLSPLNLPQVKLSVRSLGGVCILLMPIPWQACKMAKKETRREDRIGARDLSGPQAGSISRGLWEVLGKSHPLENSRVVWAGG